MQKKIIALIFALVLALSLFIAASAQEPVVLVITSESNTEDLSAGEEFKTKFAFNSITDKNGIILYEYKIDYDENVVELVDWKVNQPQAWGNLTGDFSQIITEDGNEYFLSVCLYDGEDIGKGVLDDNELFVEITFKLISETAEGTRLYAKEVMLGNDLLEQINLPDSHFDIAFTGTWVPPSEDPQTSSADASADDISTPGEQESEESGEITNSSEESGGDIGSNAGMLIGISAAAVAVIGAVVYVVLKRKK